MTGMPHPSSPEQEFGHLMNAERIANEASEQVLRDLGREAIAEAQLVTIEEARTFERMTGHLVDEAENLTNFAATDTSDMDAEAAQLLTDHNIGDQAEEYANTQGFLDRTYKNKSAFELASNYAKKKQAPGEDPTSSPFRNGDTGGDEQIYKHL